MPSPEQLLDPVRATTPTAPPAQHAASVAITRPRRERPRSREGPVVFTVALAGYLALAAHLVFRHGYLPGDSLARVGNAYGAVAGRDPHLAAIGFVWSPLPTAAIGALLPFRLLWPALVTHGFAACAVSAGAMAGMLAAVRGTLADLGVARLPRLTVLLLLGGHPMIAWYAANGMSEAVALLFLALACRSLVRWAETASVGALVSLGIWLSAAYLSRYEALGAAAAAVLVVAGVGAARATGAVRARLRLAALDAGLVAFTVVVAVAGWAAVSWLIVKHPFEQLSSHYGNSEQVAQSADAIRQATGGSPLPYIAEQILGLEPLVGVGAGLAVLAAVLRRRWAVLAPLVVFAPVAATQALLAASGQTFVWLRFQIVVIPMVALCAGAAVAGRRGPSAHAWPARWLGASVAALAVTAVLGPALPVAAGTLGDRRLAREEAGPLRALLDPSTATAGERRSTQMLAFGHVVAADLADLGPGRGVVLTDSAFSFPVVLAAADPAWFVLRSDRDFEAALARPWVFGVRYLLVPAPSGRAVNDAVNVAHPDLWRGDGLATELREWTDPTGLRWGLFQVSPPLPAPSTRPSSGSGAPARGSGGEMPTKASTGFGPVGAEQARLHAAGEVPAEPIVAAGDPVDR